MRGARLGAATAARHAKSGKGTAATGPFDLFEGGLEHHLAKKQHTAALQAPASRPGYPIGGMGRPLKDHADANTTQ